MTLRMPTYFPMVFLASLLTSFFLLPVSGYAAEPTSTCSFLGNIRMGMTHPDIKRIQQILNSDPATQIATTGPGSPKAETDFYGERTRNAVVKFQEKYASEVLAPAGLIRGSGFIGSLTRAKLMGLCGGAPAAITPTSQSVTPIALSDQVRVFDGPLNVRSVPAAGGALLTKVAIGDTGVVTGAPVLTNGRQWVKVRFAAGVEGWAAESFLSRISSTASTPTVSASSQSTSAGASGVSPSTQVRVVEGPLNVRFYPNASAAIVTKVFTGDAGVVVGDPVDSGGRRWVKVRFASGAEGWSAETFLSKVAPVSPPPVISISGGGGGSGTTVSPSPTPTPSPTPSSPTPAPTPTPVPTPTPTPSPTPTPTPTEPKFLTNDRIVTTASINVRNIPSGTRIGTQPTGMKGTIIAGPTLSGGIFWWNIQYDSAPSGWSVETYLSLAPAPTPTPSPTPTPTPTPTPPPTPPATPSALEWKGRNIGDATVPGSFILSGDTMTLRGSGSDIYGETDNFFYAYHVLDGDGELSTQILSFENTNYAAKTGIMVRESLAPTSRSSFFLITPERGFGLSSRVALGGTTTSSAGGVRTATVPIWFKLVRQGDRFLSYTSTDGLAWVFRSEATIVNSPRFLLLGLGAVSRDNTRLTTAEYRSIRTTGTHLSAAEQPVVSVTKHPVPLTVAAGANASFVADATTTIGTLSYQWQYSPTVGGTYTDIPNATARLHFGAKTAGIASARPSSFFASVISAVERLFALSNTVVMREGYYRAKIVAASGARSATVYSNPALLTVTPAPTSVPPPTPTPTPTPTPATPTSVGGNGPGAPTPIPTSGPVFYLSLAGNDTNPGTISAPWKTIGKANATLKAGETVVLRAGTYTDQRINPVNPGVANARITYMAYPGEKVVVQGRSGVGDADSAGLSARVNTDYVTLDGFTMTHPSLPLGYSYDVWVDGNHVILRNLTIASSSITWATTARSDVKYLYGSQAHWGVQMKGSDILLENSLIERMNHVGVALNGSNNIIRGNIIRENVLDAVRFAGGLSPVIQGHLIERNTFYGSWASDGVQSNSGDNDGDGNQDPHACGVVIRDNVMYDNGEQGVDIKGSCEIVVEGNIIFGTRGDSDGAVPGFGSGLGERNSGGGSISRGSRAASRDVIVRKNVLYDNYDGGGVAADGWMLYNNTYVNNNRDYTGTNSSLVPPFKGIFGARLGALKNNISGNHGLEGEVGWNGGLDIDGNMYFNTFKAPLFSVGSLTSLTHAQFKTELLGYNAIKGKDANSFVVTDPKFVNVPARPTMGMNLNFQLRSDSPAIDKGVPLTKTLAAGSGTSLKVEDSRYFFDGYGIVQGDLVKVGTNAPVRVTRVDDTTNTLTLASSITWTAGAPVSLPYSGSAPDIGAYESGYTVAATTPAPTPTPTPTPTPSPTPAPAPSPIPQTGACTGDTAPKLVHYDDFDDPVLHTDRWVDANCLGSDAYAPSQDSCPTPSTLRARSGARSLRTQLTYHNGVTGSNTWYHKRDNPNDENTHRSELSIKAWNGWNPVTLNLGEEQWYGFSTFLPGVNDPNGDPAMDLALQHSYLLPWQLHDVPDVYNTTASSVTDSTHVILSAAASSQNDYYIGTITIGGQTRTISDYVGATRTVVVAAAFSPVPSAGAVTIREPSRNPPLFFGLYGMSGGQTQTTPPSIDPTAWSCSNWYQSKKFADKGVSEGSSKCSTNMGEWKTGDLGVWTDWVFRLKPSYTNTGILEIWKNGTKVYSRIGAPTWPNDDVAGYLKIGQYTGRLAVGSAVPSDWPQRTVVYLDSHKLALAPNNPATAVDTTNCAYRTVVPTGAAH